MIIRTTLLLLMIMEISAIGKSGMDFPAFPSIPNTGFSCKNVPTGYYADLETDCQVFHICETSRKISFLCPNGTIFSQSHLICDWWFKVDCASTPTVYEASPEYHSSEKETLKRAQSFSRKSDPQTVEDTTKILMDIRRASIVIPGATKRLLRYRHRLQDDSLNTLSTARNHKYDDTTSNPIQVTKAATAIRKQKKNIVQPIRNSVPSVTTMPTYTGVRIYKGTSSTANNITETQIAAETASLVNNNRQFLRDNKIKISHPYALYTSNLAVQPTKTKSDPYYNGPSFVPHTKHYTSFVNERAPYRRPGVSFLKDFIEKEKNKTLATTTEKITQATDLYKSNDNVKNRIIIDTKDTLKLTTRIPQTTKAANTFFDETASSDIFDVYSSTNFFPHTTTEPSYQDRQGRFIHGPTEISVPTNIPEINYYRELPNKLEPTVPSSLTPNTLKNLAIYYADDLNTLSTIQPTAETVAKTPLLDKNESGDNLLALFSLQTINNYSNLFSDQTDTSKFLEIMKIDPKTMYNELSEDLNSQQTQNSLNPSPQIRELSKIFTDALSAYLQNPDNFRKLLTDVRPTHPPVNDMLTYAKESSNIDPTTTIYDEDDETLGFSEYNRARVPVASFRDSIVIATDHPTNEEELATTSRPNEEGAISTPSLPTTPLSPFKCCGRVTASYTSPFKSVDPALPVIEATASTTIVNNNGDTYNYSTTKNSNNWKSETSRNNPIRFNDWTDGKKISSGNTKPPNGYGELRNPKALNFDATNPSYIANSNSNLPKHKKIQTTTQSLPNTYEYVIETDSDELLTGDELQWSDSNSYFTSPTTQKTNLPQGKVNYDDIRTNIRKHKGDFKKLEGPVSLIYSPYTVPTTIQPNKIEENDALFTTSSIYSSTFTLPDNDNTGELQWPNTVDNWRSTVIDPITLNDNLSATGFEHVSQQVIRQTNNTETSNTATTYLPKYKLSDPAISPPKTELIPPDTNITHSAVSKIIENMDPSTTRMLMNIMKKTKSNTVKRLILLLVQTCDNEYNITAEASKKALLEALMAISQNHTDKTAEDESTAEVVTREADYYRTKTRDLLRQMNRVIETQESKSRKSDKVEEEINFNTSQIKHASHSSTAKSLSEALTEPTQSPTTTTINRRGAKKFLPQDSATDGKHVVEARLAHQGPGLNTASDTRALELLKSLYSIAARWG